MSQKSKTEGVRTSLVLSEHASAARHLVRVCVCSRNFKEQNNEFQIRKRSRMRELPPKKKRCTLSLKVFLLPITLFFKDFTEAGISKMICPFILHYTKKDMIKIGAHI